MSRPIFYVLRPPTLREALHVGATWVLVAIFAVLALRFLVGCSDVVEQVDLDEHGCTADEYWASADNRDAVKLYGEAVDRCYPLAELGEDCSREAEDADDSWCAEPLVCVAYVCEVDP